MSSIGKSILICVMFLPLSGCLESQLLEPTLIDALVDTVTALTVVNTASAPVNPYFTPIQIGLAGLVAMLEALRRKEKSARKFAENNSHVSNKTRDTNA